MKYNLKNIFHKNNDTVRETIEDLIEEANLCGEKDLSKQEQQLLNNILYLKDKKCCNVMVPRADIVAFSKDETLEDLVELMISSGHSRIPLYGESLDDMDTIAHIIDAAKYLAKGSNKIKAGQVAKHKLKFVSPSMRVLDLLSDMQRNKNHLVAVVDEYGGVDGLISIEDLLEEIVGDIEDEYDVNTICEPSINDNGTMIVDAKTDIEDLKEKTGIDIVEGMHKEMEDIDTVGGVVYQLLQRIPSRGEVIESSNGLKFRILEVDPRRIRKIMIMNLKKKDENQNSDI